MQGEAWYRPELTRQTAAGALAGQSVGRFVVRESASQPGCYALSVSLGEKTWHGVITPSVTIDGKTLYKLYAKHKFETLPLLVDFYRKNPLAWIDGGRPVMLMDGDVADE